GPVRAHGIAGGPRRRRRVPRLVGQRLRGRPDAQRRRRQLDELTTSSGGFGPMYLDRFNLKGRVAIVTGGGQGIGLACVEALSEAGAQVFIADRDPKAAAEGQAAMKAKGYAVEVIE